MTEREVSSERVSEDFVGQVAKEIAKHTYARCLPQMSDCEDWDAMEEADRKIYRAAAEAVLALRSSVKTVGVKKLEWSDTAPPTDGVSYYDHCLAVSALGEYRIEWKSWKRYEGFCVYGPLEFFECESTLDAAKAAAQADYERRILSALEAPNPQEASSEVTEQMVERGLAQYSEGGCMGLSTDERREVVRDILTAALKGDRS